MAAAGKVGRVVLGALLSVGLPVLLLATVDSAWVWIFLLWAVLAFVAAFRRRETRRGRVYLALAALLVAVTAVEGWLTFFRHAHGIQGDPFEGYVRQHEVFGYCPEPGAEIEVRHLEHGELLFEVTYTIGEDGWRVTSSPDASPTEGCVLCFGGSFTYGDGLENEQSYPWVLAEALERRLAVHNLGFHAWGANQMLAGLESGRFRETAQAPARGGIYLAISHHVLRSSGLVPWGKNAPRYVSDGRGGVERKGTFLDIKPEEVAWTRRLAEGLLETVKRSHVLRRVLPGPRPGVADLELYLDIVDAARREFEATWPEGRFVVLYWDSEGEEDLPVIEGLRSRGHELHLASTFLPGLGKPPSIYQLGRWDGHPSAEGARRVATYVAEQVVTERDR